MSRQGLQAGLYWDSITAGGHENKKQFPLLAPWYGVGAGSFDGGRVGTGSEVGPEE